MTNPKHTDTSRSGDLKPCPFCGGEAVDFYRANTGATADWCGPVDHWVCCTGECGASTCMHGTKDEAIAAWNTRTADRIEALEAENERLCVVIGDNARFVCKILDEQDVEIERLRAEVARLGAVLRNLEMSEAQYREVHDLDGYGSSQARRAWDLMRRAGDAARAALGEK